MEIDFQGIENQTQDSAPSEAPQAESAQATPEMQAILDLSKAEKVKFGNEEYSVKDLLAWKKDGLRQADYTRKTQDLASRQASLEQKLQSEYEQKYEPYKKYSGQNLMADLMTVKKNPQLVGEFLTTYPKEYHGALEMLGIEAPRTQMQAQIDPDTQAKIDQFLEMGEMLKTREQQAVNAEIDAQYSRLTQKFPLVDEEVATVKLSLIAQKKGTLEPQDYEAVFKSLNDQAEQKYKAIYSKQVTEQKTKNKQGQDVPAGGGLPGLAPKPIKSFDEANALILQALNRQS